jgi:hypothetical protein
MALNCARKYGGNNAKHISVDETVNICGVRDIWIYIRNWYLSENGHNWAGFSTVHECSPCWQVCSQVSTKTEDYLYNSCFLTRGIKSEQHSETLGKLKTRLRRVYLRNEQPLLQNENAWSPTKARLSAEIWRLCLTPLGPSYAPYSTDLAPSVLYHFFTEYHWCSTMQTVVRLWFRHQDANFYRDGQKTR